MSLIQLAKNALWNFPELKKARKTAFGKIIFYFMLLCALAAIPITLPVIQVFHAIQADGQEIAKNIPDFTISDGKIQTKAVEGFIYQTDSIIFTFAPDGQRSAEDVAQDMVGNFLSIGLLAEELVVSFPATDAALSILGSNQLELSYREAAMENLNGQTFRNLLANNQLPWWMYLLTFVVAFYPSFLNLLSTLVLATLFGNLYARFKQVGYSFLENLKMMVVAMTLPLLILTVIQSFGLLFNTTIALLFGSLVIFAQAVKAEKITH